MSRIIAFVLLLLAVLPARGMEFSVLPNNRGITVASQFENSAANGADVTLTLTGLNPGDLVVVSTGLDGGSANPGIVDTPGYTCINATSAGSDTCYKLQGGTVDTNVICEGSGNAAIATACVATVFRGTSPSSPVIATAEVSGSSTNPDPTTITPTGANDSVVVVGCISQVNDTAITAPSGYSNQIDIAQSETTTSVTVGQATLQKSTEAAEDPASWTNWATGGWRCFTLALRPL